jgi:hypothetical protein
VSETAVNFLREVINQFGVPVEPVRIKDSGTEPECAAGRIIVRQIESDFKMVRKIDAFPSKFYRAADVTSPILLTIKDVTLQRMPDGADKYVMSFGEVGSKWLVLTPTKWDAIGYIAGSDDTDDWRGVQVVLYADRVTYGGKLVDGIKIRAPKKKGPPTKPESQQPPPVAPVGTEATGEEQFNDEIPF